IETEDHSVILSEGLETETYIDYVGRAQFDNHDEYIELYGNDRVIPEMTMPRVSAKRLVPEEIRMRLLGDASLSAAKVA
ncbi:hypothetical protein AB9K41_27420, partial [Cribrihabitans sp. XS_ASV171]